MGHTRLVSCLVLAALIPGMHVVVVVLGLRLGPVKIVRAAIGLRLGPVNTVRAVLASPRLGLVVEVCGSWQESGCSETVQKQQDHCGKEPCLDLI